MKQKQRRNVKGRAAKSVLRLPDLEVAKSAVLSGLSCPVMRSGAIATPSTNSWTGIAPSHGSPLNKTVVIRYRMHLQSRHLAPGTINLRLGAVRRLAYEAADCGLLSADLAAGIRRVKGVKKLGVRLGNWLTAEQGATLWQVPDRERLKGKRDRALLSSCLRVGSGVMKWPSWPLATSSNARDIGRSLISGRSRSDGADSRLVYRELSTWTEAAGIHSGRVFRRVSSPGKPWGDGVTEKLAWHVVKEFATKTGVANLAPTTFAEHELSYVGWPEENWSKFSFCLAMSPSKPPSVTSAVRSGSLRQ